MGDGSNAHTLFYGAIDQRIREAAQRENTPSTECGSAESGIGGGEIGAAKHFTEKSVC